MRPKRFQDEELKGSMCLSVKDLDYITSLQKLGFTDIDHGKKTKQGNRNYKPRYVYKFNYWNNIESYEYPKSHSLIFKVHNVKEKRDILYKTNNVMLVTANANCKRALDLDSIPKILHKSSELMLTNKGFMTMDNILKIILRSKGRIQYIDEDQYIKKLINVRDKKLVLYTYGLGKKQTVLFNLICLYASYKSKQLTGYYNSRYGSDRDRIDYKTTWHDKLKEELTSITLHELLEYSDIDNYEQYNKYKLLDDLILKGAKHDNR